MLALSIRQPWAWLILNAGKDIENRDWQTKFRGEIYIHASKGMTQEEYENGMTLLAIVNPTIEEPTFESLQRGGIVGTVEIVDCVAERDSAWFFGKYGFVLKNAKGAPFIPCRGMPGFFKPNLP